MNIKKKHNIKMKQNIISKNNAAFVVINFAIILLLLVAIGMEIVNKTISKF